MTSSSDQIVRLFLMAATIASLSVILSAAWRVKHAVDCHYLKQGYILSWADLSSCE